MGFSYIFTENKNSATVQIRATDVSMGVNVTLFGVNNPTD